MRPSTVLFNYLQNKDFLLLTHRRRLTSAEAVEWYPEWIYEVMETDEIRNRQYRAVLDKLVHGKTVLELGTGRHALWACYAAQQGAKKVFAIEANKRAVLSSQAVVDSRDLRQVNLIHGFSDQISVPERCDLLVHDLVGSIGSCEGMVPFIEDAKARLLKHGAMHVPARCTTYFFPSALPEQSITENIFNFLLRGCRPIRRMPIVLMYGYRTSAMLAEPQIFEDIIFTEPLNLESRRVNEFRVTRKGYWDALIFFIRLYVDSNHIIDSLASRTNWYLPYIRPFTSPVKVQQGDIIKVESSISLGSGNPRYNVICRHGRNGSLNEIANHSWSGT